MTYTTDREYQGVTRAVCIGLGGSGLQTIMRLRRLIVERYDSLDNFPIVRFVQIDTDSGSLNNAHLGGTTFHRGVDISFKQEEKVHIGMKATDAEALRYSLNNSQSGTPYEHIREWLPDYVIENSKAIDNGAGGIRAVGRLAFFHNYAAIKRAITNAEMNTRGQYPHLMQQYGLIQDEGLDIFIVGSLYGGTGSGTFLDVAYSVRKLYPNNKIHGYLVVNPELQGNGFSQQANIYAALMELDFYSRGENGNEFRAFYDRNDPQSMINTNKPPFDYTFLVGRNTNTSTYVIKEKDKLFNLIAQKISAEFSSRFAPKLKEKRVDCNYLVSTNDNHPRPNPQYYLTFGLAEIYCPIDRIIEIISARVACSLMQFWQSGFGQAPDIMSLMQTFYTTYDWYDDINERRGFPEKRLNKLALEGNNTADALLTAWKRNCETNLINACQTSSDRESLSTQAKNTFRSQFRKVEFGDNDAMRGAWLTKIMREVPTYTDQYRQNIEAFRLRLLNPSEDIFSIGNAQSWITKLVQDLNDNRRRLEKEIGDLGAVKTLDGLEARWRLMESEIEIENRKFGWFGLLNQNQAVKTIARRYLEETRKAIEHNRKLFCANQSLEITDQLNAYCQAISINITSANGKALDIEVAYRGIETKRRDLNINELNGEAIFDDQDVIDAENKLISPESRLVKYQQITRDLNQVLLVDKSLVELLGQISYQEIIQKMDQVLESIFSNQLGAFTRPVIDAFLERYQPVEPEAKNRLREILKMAEYRLAINLNDPFLDPDESLKYERFAGFFDAQTTSANIFRNILTQNQVDDRERITLTDKEKDRFVVITEIAAFPLRIIEGLENYKYQYKRIYSTKPLHNDKRIQFTDIIPPTVEEIKRLQDLFFPCLALGLLGDYEQQNLRIEYYSQRACDDKIALLKGNWDQCMELISRDRDLLNGLKLELEKAEEGLTKESWGVGKTEDSKSQEKKAEKAKIDNFQNYVDTRMANGYNKRYYEEQLVGRKSESGEIGILVDRDTPILKRYHQKIERMLNDREREIQQGRNLQSNQINILTSDPNANQPIDVDVEIVDEPNNKEPSLENLKKRSEEIAKYKKALAEEDINQEEYDRNVKQIKERYPI